ncbi:MAG: SPFH domain-containing protein [Pirellulales bacterium]
MEFFKRSSFWIGLAALFVGLLIVQQIWHWEVERVEVPPGKFLVRVHRWGTNLAEDQIVAPDTSYKGIMLDVLPEGRHFLNPFFWSYEVHDMVRVEPGTCLVLTRKFGREIPAARIAAGDLLAREDAANPIEGERGILRDVKLPGSYRLNPYAYSWEVVPAVEVRVSQVGVRTLKVGRDPRTIPEAEALGRYVVPAGYRGVQQDIVPPGTYYINPFVETITPIDVRSHRVELTDIAFPSRDGFLIQPRVVVEYAVQAEKAAEMLVRLTDAGVMHQADVTPEEQQENEILQKVILPHIRGYARIEGSNFDARDFILVAAADPATKQTNAREVMQKALLEKVRPRCAELGVEIRAVTLADLRPPAELSDQIAQRELARVELEKNAVRVRQFQAEQELKAKEELQQQAKEKVEAETRLVQAKTKAGQTKEVEESRLRQELASAQLRLEASRKTAEATLSRGRAEAAVLTAQNEAEVAGLRRAVEGFRGVQNYAQFQMISRLAPALSEIFASDDSDFARIFAGYMTPGDTTPAAGPPAATAQTPEKTVAAP